MTALCCAGSSDAVCACRSLLCLHSLHVMDVPNIYMLSWWKQDTYTRHSAANTNVSDASLSLTVHGLLTKQMHRGKYGFISFTSPTVMVTWQTTQSMSEWLILPVETMEARTCTIWQNIFLKCKLCEDVQRATGKIMWLMENDMSLLENYILFFRNNKKIVF